MKLLEWIQRIEQIFPKEWALPDDPIGLHIGDPDQEIKRVMLGLEASTPLLDETIAKGAECLFVHHPLLYRPLRNLVESQPVQRLSRRLIKNDIALYAAHTNVDLHPDGMAKRWARKLGCDTFYPLAPKPQTQSLKLITFVTSDHTDALREALSQAGAGIIGEYDLCSYTLQGEGTFRGSENTDPFIGQAGTVERAKEDRLEMVLPLHRKEAVIKALWEHHPYEEPAYDLFRQEDFQTLNQAMWMGEFPNGIGWDALLQRIQSSLPKPPEFMQVRPNPPAEIKRIALSTGSGNSILSAAAQSKADVYITGEIGYHILWEAQEMGLNVITVGHGASESIFAETVLPLVQQKIPEVEFVVQETY